ncbi:MAG: helix-turn-helix domain-containing protein [Oscillospiraceae bacterium]|nr:helix-turn-helix domain-containing protein [Oscillospiraceae bacterium]
MIDYSPLWETMRRKRITQYRLLKSGIDNKTLDTLKKNKNITLLTLERLCIILDCTPNDVVAFLPDTPEQDT